jgi:hypothetical protein
MPVASGLARNGLFFVPQLLGLVVGINALALSQSVNCKAI